MQNIYVFSFMAIRRTPSSPASIPLQSTQCGHELSPTNSHHLI
jgi:hypothetical protein